MKDDKNTFIIVGIGVLFLAYSTYGHYKNDSEIKVALGDYKVKNYDIEYSGKVNDEINDYSIKGTLENGENFIAYMQYSPKQTGLQIRYGGFTSCSGYFYNPKLELCNDSY